MIHTLPNTSARVCKRREAPRYVEVNRRNTAFLAIDGLVKHYPVAGFGAQKVVKSLDGVSLNVQPGEVMGLVGESGCGKSTFAKMICRLSSATDGQITIGGEDWFAPKGEVLRRQRRDVQLIFQDPHSALDPRMTVGTSMSAPMAHHGIGSDTADRRRRVIAMLEEVGLDESYYDRLPHQCSGGQLQRVVIGRALLLEPRLLICDEPTSALDASMRTQILNLLRELRVRRGITMVMISHDLRVVRYLCDRIAVMYMGKLVELADRKQLFETPAHPYTRALIAASMLEENGLDGAAGLLQGEPPSPLNPPAGCTFHERCPMARADCATDAPYLKQAQPGHFVRCRYWNQQTVESSGAPADLTA